MGANNAGKNMASSRSPGRTIARRTLLGALPALPAGAWAQSRTTPSVYNFAPVRKDIQNAIVSGKATGIAVAAIHHGRITWEEGFGWANREARLRATANTPFSLASITKPFTATALASLAAERKLALDEPANHYLSGSMLRGADADRVTIRQLGAHASGLPSMFEMYMAGRDAPGADALLRNYGALAYPAGRVYEYGNIGYAALGAIASKADGMAFEKLFTHRILEPLGLRDSFFDSAVNRLAGAAARYSRLDKPIPYYTTATPPSGELYASAHDLALFAALHLKNCNQTGSPILDGHWIDEI